MKRLLLAALLLTAFGVQADENEDAKWRVGAGAAFGDYDGDDNAVPVDDSQVGFALFGGYQFNKWFGVEGGYLNTGDFEDRIGSGADTTKIEISYKGFHIAGVAYAPIGSDDIALYGKLGFFDFDTDVSENGSISQSGHQDGAMGGAGAVINIADNFGIRAEALVFDVDDGDFWTAIIGAEYQF